MSIPEIKVIAVRETAAPKATIRAAADIAAFWTAEITKSAWYDPCKEACLVFLLDTRCGVQSYHLVSLGTLNASLVHPREVFRAAIAGAAHSIILAHNHPSGQTDPSPDDVAITRRIADSGRIVDIQVLDHIIVADGGAFTSLKGQGLL